MHYLEVSCDDVSVVVVQLEAPSESVPVKFLEHTPHNLQSSDITNVGGQITITSLRGR